MPPRKSQPLDPSARQAAFRDRMREAGLERMEVYVPAQVKEDEAFVREELGVDRVRTLIGWVLEQERNKLLKEGRTPRTPLT